MISLELFFLLLAFMLHVAWLFLMYEAVTAAWRGE